MVDFNLNEGEPTINSDLEILVQQIDILFDTKPGDLLGEISFGTDYSKFLYELQVSADVLRDQMLSDLQQLDLMGFIPQVEVYLMQGTQRDIAVIEVQLKRNSINFTKTYKIT